MTDIIRKREPKLSEEVFLEEKHMISIIKATPKLSSSHKQMQIDDGIWNYGYRNKAIYHFDRQTLLRSNGARFLCLHF